MGNDEYPPARGEDDLECGGRVHRATHDENELHPVSREAVVSVRARAADRSGRW